MSSPALPESGSTLAGRYVLGRVLGKGAMGLVFEAEQKRLEQRVAIKVLRPEILDEPALVTRFEREARLMAKLNSPHIVRVLDVDVTEAGLPFLVMEYLEGRDLSSELKATGRFDLPRALDVVRQLCIGVEEAHRAGVIHRDLKPSNVFLVQAPEGSAPAGSKIVKIVDFGVSKLVGQDQDMTATASTLGTPRYMSPEQIRSAKNVDQRSDVWAVATIFFELLAGRTPFTGESATGVAAAIVTEHPLPLRTVRTDIPPAIEAVIDAALVKNPERRIQTAQAFRQALDQAAAAVLGSPPPSGPHAAPRAPEPPRSLPAMATPPPSAHAPMNVPPMPGGASFAAADARNEAGGAPSSSGSWQTPLPPPSQDPFAAQWTSASSSGSLDRPSHGPPAHAAGTQDSWSRPPPFGLVATPRRSKLPIVVGVVAFVGVGLVVALLLGTASRHSSDAKSSADAPTSSPTHATEKSAAATAPTSTASVAEVGTAAPSLESTDTAAPSAAASAPTASSSPPSAKPSDTPPAHPVTSSQRPLPPAPKTCADSMKILVGGKLVCP